jgi:hypothetical protein
MGTASTMILVRLAGGEHRDGLAAFLRLSSLTVTYPESTIDTLCVDFTAFDFDEQAQLRIVRRMLAAWSEEHQSGALHGAHLEIQQ